MVFNSRLNQVQGAPSLWRTMEYFSWTKRLSLSREPNVHQRVYETRHWNLDEIVHIVTHSSLKTYEIFSFHLHLSL